MAMNLDKLSSELEDALERARLLAEQRKQAQIGPVHMLYVLLDHGSPLMAQLDRAGVAVTPLLESFATRLNKEAPRELEPGKRPTASRALRDLIEKSFTVMEQRGAERAEPIDFILASVEFSEEQLKGDLRGAGVTKERSRKLRSPVRHPPKHLANRAPLPVNQTASCWSGSDAILRLRPGPAN